ncbi:MAG: hypothetical protein GXY77_20360 [Fibrobacter sp.]|nr:hypothetical protein [Fibrobacter sp.]
MDINVHNTDILPLSKKASLILSEIAEKLEALLYADEVSCLTRNFRKCIAEIMVRFSEYQNEVLRYSKLKKSCKKGCSYCCCHWVEDVNSFEMDIIADYIKTNIPEKIEEIIRSCKADIQELERVDEIVNIKLSKLSGNEKVGIDQVDLLLSVFYQLERKCPLLASDGSCMIYDIRPITCRIYMNFSDPFLCKPGYINKDNVVTCLLDLNEKSNNLLDQLHFKYLRFRGDTGLRSLLVKYLE